MGGHEAGNVPGGGGAEIVLVLVVLDCLVQREATPSCWISGEPVGYNQILGPK
jgi:hypothetical protein